MRRVTENIDWKTALALSTTFFLHASADNDAIKQSPIMESTSGISSAALLVEQSNSEISSRQYYRSSYSFPTSRSPEKLTRQIRTLIMDTPVLDGYTHPAEEKIEILFKHFSDDANGLLSELLTTGDRNPGFVADLLRVVSRCELVSEELRFRFISGSLSSSSTEIRDAAVQAAENWGNPAFVDLLRSHDDDCVWLADYISRVADDLEG